MIVARGFKTKTPPTIVFAWSRLGAAVALAVLLAGAGAASAQEEYRGTSDQQAACTPDVFRLCWDDIQNVSRIVACLRRQRPSLSPACRAVFDASAPTRTARHVFRGKRHLTEDQRRARRLSRRERANDD